MSKCLAFLLRQMTQLDELTTDVSFFPLHLFCLHLWRKVCASTWTIYLLNLFSPSYSSILFLLGSFCLQNAKIFMFQSHFCLGSLMKLSIYLFFGTELEVVPCSGSFPFLSPCPSLPTCKANGLSLVLSCIGHTSSFLKCSAHLMSTTLPLPASPSASIKAHSRTCPSVPILLYASKCWHSSRTFIVLFLCIMWSNSLQWLPLPHWQRFLKPQVEFLQVHEPPPPPFPNSLWDIYFWVFPTQHARYWMNEWLHIGTLPRSAYVNWWSYSCILESSTKTPELFCLLSSTFNEWPKFIDTTS